MKKYALHKLDYKGYRFHLYWKSEGRQVAKALYLVDKNRTEGYLFRTGSIRYRMEELVESAKDHKRRTERLEYVRSLSASELIGHENFAYARFKPSGLGNYYQLYWRSPESPTGVESVGGVTEAEWEKISKALGKSHCYLSPTEGR